MIDIVVLFWGREGRGDKQAYRVLVFVDREKKRWLRGREAVSPICRKSREISKIDLLRRVSM